MEAGTSGSASAFRDPSWSSDRDDHLVRLSSSSASSSCASFDPLELDERANANGLSASNGHQKLETISGSAFRLGHNDGVPSSSLSTSKQSNNELVEPSSGPAGSYHAPGSSLSSRSITQSPQVQMMERTGDLEGARHQMDPYRIPSSVFARTKSTAPQEWSTTSNESLFSIHMGTMSFNKDLYSICKSGELGKGGELVMSPHMMDYPSNLPSPNPASNSIDIFKKNVTLDEGLHATPEAVETMKAVLRENAETDLDEENSSHAEGASCHSAIASPSCLSSASGGSDRSFVFPT